MNLQMWGKEVTWFLMKLAKTEMPLKRASSSRALTSPVNAPVRRVNRDKLNRLAGCWPKGEADRIAAFIAENCEAANEDE